MDITRKPLPLDIDKHVMLAFDIDNAHIRGDLDNLTLNEVAKRYPTTGTEKYTLAAVRYVFRWMKRHGVSLPKQIEAGLAQG
jgi:hypothetical protein